MKIGACIGHAYIYQKLSNVTITFPCIVSQVRKMSIYTSSNIVHFVMGFPVSYIATLDIVSVRFSTKEI